MYISSLVQNHARVSRFDFALPSAMFLAIFLLASQSVLIWIALSPPSESKESERRQSTWVARYVKKFAAYLKIVHVVYCGVELLSLLLRFEPDESFSCDAPFVLGSLAILVGSILRLVCYNRLGNLFTFELSIRSSHQLVTTGPYAYVRHPAYSGLILVLLGEFAVQFAPGSVVHVISNTYFDGLGVLKAVYFLSIITPIALIVWSLLWRRIALEEKALKTQFGKDWNEWERTTPYLLVPFVY